VRGKRPPPAFAGKQKAAATKACGWTRSRLKWGLMSKRACAVVVCLLWGVVLAAQTEPATWGGSRGSSTAASNPAVTKPNSTNNAAGQQGSAGNAGAQSAGAGATNAQQNLQKTPDQKDLEKIAFARRGVLPDSPKEKAKAAEEDSACPGGEGNPCALLGGWRYYSDQWHITEHQATWWEAYKTPGMLFSTSALFASTVVDIEGTQHCLSAGTCRELNPMMGKTRAHQYGVAMPMDGLLTWLAVREKQHGRGVLPFFMLWGLSTVHLYYGVNGLTPQGSGK
jgi:hypothetical protein